MLDSLCSVNQFAVFGTDIYIPQMICIQLDSKVLFEPFSSNFLSSAFGVKVKSQTTVLSSVLLKLCFFIMKYS